MTSRSNFDRVAGVYRWAEYLSLGRLLQRTRTHFLPQVAHSQRAVVLGDGDGRFIARLLKQNPSLHAVAIDTSARMLQLLRQRCAFAEDRLRTQQISAMDALPAPGTDLVITHFFLDCLPQHEVDALAARLFPLLEPGALWLISDFRIPPRGLLRYIAAAYIRMLYFAFHIFTGLEIKQLPEPAAALQTAGFRCIRRRRFIGGILYAELWQR